MAKVYKLFNQEEANQEALIEHIKDLLKAAESGDIKNVAVAAQSSDGDIVTGWCNCDMGERQLLVAHMQVDLNFDVVAANIDQLIEMING